MSYVYRRPITSEGGGSAFIALHGVFFRYRNVATVGVGGPRNNHLHVLSNHPVGGELSPSDVSGQMKLHVGHAGLSKNRLNGEGIQDNGIAPEQIEGVVGHTVSVHLLSSSFLPERSKV